MNIRNERSPEPLAGRLKLFIRLTKMIRPHKKLLIASVLFSITGHLSTIGLTGFAAVAAAVIITDGKFSLPAVIAAVICVITRGALRYGEHYFGHDIAFRLLFDIRKKIFEAVNRLAPAKLLDRKTGDICSTVMADVECVETFFAHTLAPVIVGIIVPIIMLSVFAAIKPEFALIMLPFYLLMGLFVPVVSFQSSAADGNEYRNSLSKMNSMLVENLQGLKELMLFNREEERLDGILRETGLCNHSYRKIRSNEGLLAAVVEIIMLAAAAAVIGFGGGFVVSGTADIGDLITVAVLSITSFGPLISLIFLSNSLVNTAAAAGRIFALIDEKPVVDDMDELQGGCITDFRIEEPPTAESVNFVYPGTGRKILEDLSLTIKKNRITALKAESGRGKSTVLYLMMRFFDPTNGRMILNKSDLKKFNLDCLRGGISYFTQETTLFNISVMDNIRLADESATDEEVFKSAEKAGIHHYICSLPSGYNTTAGEQGSRFSSGERQRIGLARIFLQNNHVILLDEPVSNLDSENEKLIMQNLKNGLEGRTVVLVSHRPSVIDIADDIIEF
ncbi:MAG: ABC transporter ATP-binding protein [Spirochaetales bacterium]|nr:ABC transporter ATP-binding protein [Spirochaetales bacterium]